MVRAYRVILSALLFFTVSGATAEEEETVYLSDEVDHKTVFIELQADTLNPYVHSQVLVTLRLYRDSSSFHAAMSYPKLYDPLMNKEGMLRSIDVNSRNYKTVKDFRNYNVTERQYVLYPETSGVHILVPARYEGQIVKGGTINFVEVDSNKITLNVRPIADIFDGNVWIPARSVELYQDFQPPEGSIRVGTPISRILFFSATGLGSGHVPSFFIPEIEGFRIYPRRTERKEIVNPEKGLIAVLQQEVVLVPTISGTFTIPAIEVPWWNTLKDQLETASFPGKSVTVLPAGDNAESGSNEDSRSPIQVSGGYTPGVSGLVKGKLLTVTMTLLAIILIAGSVYYGYRIRTGDRTGRRADFLFKRVVDACFKNEPKAAETAILAYMKVAAPEVHSRSIEHVAMQTDADLRDLLLELDAHIYAAGENTWRGKPLAEKLIIWDKHRKQRQQTDMSEILPCMYPLASGK
ncbi:MAG: hypothetical protein MI673_07865 [Thiotrichales bacterium]|nr:hypothetical protein [Thiotrichales bacterium]